MKQQIWEKAQKYANYMLKILTMQDQQLRWCLIRSPAGTIAKQEGTEIKIP